MNVYTDGIRPGPKMTHWKKPSKQVAMADCVGLIIQYDTGWESISCAGYSATSLNDSTLRANPVSQYSRHGSSGSNILFLDGHVTGFVQRAITPTDANKANIKLVPRD